MRHRGGPSAEIRRLLSQRADAMAVLVDRPCRKDDLTDALDISRSTVDRTVRQFETAGLARREAGQVTATLAGQLALESYRRYCEETDDIARFTDLLQHLPAAATVDHDMLDGATAYRSDPPATGRPSNEVTDLFRRANRVRGCAKVINDSAAAEEFFRMVTERGGCGEFVYSVSLADHLREAYFEMTHELVSTGRYRAHEIDTLPHELFIIEGQEWARVAVLVYDETETLRGAVVNDTDAAVEWAEAAFACYREAATEFTDYFRIGQAETTETTETTTEE